MTMFDRDLVQSSHTEAEVWSLMAGPRLETQVWSGGRREALHEILKDGGRRR